MKLDKALANKVVTVDSSRVVEVPAGVFSTGDTIVLFNNTDAFVCIDSQVENSYRSGTKTHRTKLEFPPKGLGNILFINEQTVVFSGEIF